MGWQLLPHITNYLAERNALPIALSISLAYDKAMNKDEQQQLKDTLAEVTEALKDETLSGSLLSTWLPVDWGRRLIMIAIVALGLYYAIMEENFEPLLWWLVLPIFSPRIGGMVSYFIGALTGGKKQ